MNIQKIHDYLANLAEPKPRKNPAKSQFTAAKSSVLKTLNLSASA